MDRRPSPRASDGACYGPTHLPSRTRRRPLAPDGPLGDALLTNITRDLKNRTHCVALECLPGEDGSADRLARAFRKAGWIAHLSVCDTNHVLDVKGRSFAEYWADRPGQMRSTLKRKAGKWWS